MTFVSFRNNKHYLVQPVDYYSRYIDVTYLPSLTSATVIGKLKNFFSHHGVPETVVSDNGTQFCSAEFRTVLRIGGTSAMSPAVPTIRKAMVLRSER